MNVVRAAFEQLGWNMTPVNTLEEQHEALKRDYLDMAAKWDGAREESAEHERSAARLEREKAGLIEQLETLQGVANGVIWLDNNIHNYGSDGWCGYFKAVLRDARAALASSPASERQS